jgi:hypothetical protein
VEAFASASSRKGQRSRQRRSRQMCVNDKKVLAILQSTTTTLRNRYTTRARVKHPSQKAPVCARVAHNSERRQRKQRPL